jgi:hypothetical protein
LRGLPFKVCEATVERRRAVVASSYVPVSKKQLKPKKKCCNSKPRCKRCPVRLKKELRKQELKKRHRK